MSRDADPLRYLAPVTPRLSGLRPVRGEGVHPAPTASAPTAAGEAVATGAPVAAGVPATTGAPADAGAPAATGGGR